MRVQRAGGKVAKNQPFYKNPNPNPGFSKCLKSTKIPGFLKVLGVFECLGWFFVGFLHKNTGFLVIHEVILKGEGAQCGMTMVLSPSCQDEI